MHTAMLRAVPVVLGSLVGGAATTTRWISQKTLDRRDLLREESTHSKFSSGGNG